MDHQLDKLGCMDHDEFEHLARAIGADYEVPEGIVAELEPDGGVVVGMPDVVIGDPMTAGRVMDLPIQ